MLITAINLKISIKSVIDCRFMNVKRSTHVRKIIAQHKNLRKLEWPTILFYTKHGHESLLIYRHEVEEIYSNLYLHSSLPTNASRKPLLKSLS